MKPTKEAIVLGRLAYGHNAADLERLGRAGLKRWLDEQLAPPVGDDPETSRRLAEAKFRIEYPEEAGKWPKVNEDRPLSTLDADLKSLWHLRDWQKPMPYQERVRPRDEVNAATWIRALYSPYQLREVMVGFWHDHFHVNALHDDVAIAVAWPHYDRIMRKHALGNFRAFLEDVAKSPAMLVYLNNRSSKASPANENYARELFELHTLGKDAYLNDLYNRWRDVPGATKGEPVGYIDQDVYEAARAFTGWTLADGSWSGEGPLPSTGEFMYHAAWHDPYQKRVLGREFEANAPPMADGVRVLDLVADHPATAKHLATKLVRKLVADDPPAGLVNRAADTWMRHRKSPDQIARVVRVIAESKEFAETWGKKAKRPFEYFVSFLRATGAEVKPDPGMIWLTFVMGERMFGWPTPDGPPDKGSAWLGTNAMLGRWNGAFWLASKDHPSTRHDWVAATPERVTTLGAAAQHWCDVLLPGTEKDAMLASLREAIGQWAPPETPLDRSQGADAIAGIAALVALSPEFNLK